MFILFLAQICYAGMMVFFLEPVLGPEYNNKAWKEKSKERTKKSVLLFIMTLPFGQLVPLYLMAVNAFPAEFERVHSALGYKSILSQMQKNIFFIKDDQSGSNHDDEDSLNQSDPLSLYIRHKLMSHLGFLIEAIVEAYVHPLALSL